MDRSVEGFSAWGSGNHYTNVNSATPARSTRPHRIEKIKGQKAGGQADGLPYSPRTGQSDFVEFCDAETPRWRFRASLLGENKDYRFTRQSEVNSSNMHLSDASAVVRQSDLKGFNRCVDEMGVIRPGPKLKKNEFGGRLR